MAVILLVGSEKDRAQGIRTLLREDGHDVIWCRRESAWHTEEHDTKPQIVVAAVENIDQVTSNPGRPLRGFPAPLLWVQQDAEFARDPFMDDRLVDRISSPFLREELLGRVDALIRVREVLYRGPQGVRAADTERKGIRGFAGRLSAMLGTRVPKYTKPLRPYLDVAARLAEWTDQRDAFEPGHSERVTACCAVMSDIIGLPDDESTALLRSALLHDIGKVSLPVDMLRQPEPLDENQRRLIRTHPRRGAALVRALDRNDAVADTVLYHHERPDGSGYYGLAPEKTPRTARILAVAEVYDALTHSRLRPKLSGEEALEALETQRGKSLDTECVDALAGSLRRKRESIPFRPEC